MKALVTQAELAAMPAPTQDLLQLIMAAMDEEMRSTPGPERVAAKGRLHRLLDRAQNDPVAGPYVMRVVQRLFDVEQGTSYADQPLI